MWLYSQSTGTLTAPDGSLAGQGYSGHGPGINNAAMQNVPDVGPIPVGLYTIGPFRSDPEKGPLVCDLIPDPENEMFGRSGMMMHGDEILHLGERLASHGCIIQDHLVRLGVSKSADKRLQVNS